MSATFKPLRHTITVLINVKFQCVDKYQNSHSNWEFSCCAAGKNYNNSKFEMVLSNCYYYYNYYIVGEKTRVWFANRILLTLITSKRSWRLSWFLHFAFELWGKAIFTYDIEMLTKSNTHMWWRAIYSIQKSIGWVKRFRKPLRHIGCINGLHARKT